MAKSSPQEFLEQDKKIKQSIWKKQDIKSMALECIDYLCIAVEDGMNKDKALELIYEFSHCASDSICYDSHEDWRKDLKKFYKEEFIKGRL
jgi:hypothetical protein